MVKKKKDFGEHDKKTAARDRRAANRNEEKERQSKEQEDQYWREAGEGTLTKAQARRKEQEKQKQAALAKKQEIKELAKAEDEDLAKSKKPKGGRVIAPKVTQHALLLGKEQRAAEMEEEIAQRKKIERKEVDEESYARLVVVENVNRAETDIDARNVTDAIHALQKLTPAEQPLAEDAHPEKRRKAAFKKFYEEQLAELQEEKPGLRLSQYKDIIFKRWLKSPENPMNRIADD